MIEFIIFWYSMHWKVKKLLIDTHFIQASDHMVSITKISWPANNNYNSISDQILYANCCWFFLRILGKATIYKLLVLCQTHTSLPIFNCISLYTSSLLNNLRHLIYLMPEEMISQSPSNVYSSTEKLD